MGFPRRLALGTLAACAAAAAASCEPHTPSSSSEAFDLQLDFVDAPLRLEANETASRQPSLEHAFTEFSLYRRLAGEAESITLDQSTESLTRSLWWESKDRTEWLRVGLRTPLRSTSFEAIWAPVRSVLESRGGPPPDSFWMLAPPPLRAISVPADYVMANSKERSSHIYLRINDVVYPVYWPTPSGLCGVGQKLGTHGYLELSKGIDRFARGRGVHRYALEEVSVDALRELRTCLTSVDVLEASATAEGDKVRLKVVSPTQMAADVTCAGRQARHLYRRVFGRSGGARRVELDFGLRDAQADEERK